MTRRVVGELPGMGRRLRRLRLDAGLTQNAVAARMRLAGHATWVHNTVAALENDQRHLRLSESFDLAGIYTVSLHQLAHAPRHRHVALVTNQVRRLTYERRYLRARLRELDAALAPYESSNNPHNTHPGAP